MLLATLLGLVVRWELYQRFHTEYATSVDWVDGGLEAVTAVSAADAARTESYVRLTRQGRWGRIIKAEVLNALGNPAVLRRTLTAEKIPIYVEGIGGAQPYGEKLPETSSVDFVLNGNDVAEATSRDRNGQVNWRVIYDRVGSTGSIARARFANLRDFEASPTQRASHMEFERDNKGRDKRIRFFDSSGKPATNGEGVYGYSIERDKLGRLAKVMNLGANGAPIANRVEVFGFTVTWNGNTSRFQALNGEGQPTQWKNLSAVVTEYDSAGNSIRITNQGSDNQPFREASAEWSVQELKRNEHGQLIQRTLFKADASGTLKQIRQTNVSYDEFGHPADLSVVGDNPWRSAMTYDQKGNVTEEKNLNAAGQPVLGEKGYAITRSSYVSSAQGLRIEQTYFDVAGNKTYCTAGYHRVINEYDVTGMLKRQTLDEHDPSQYKYYRYVTEPEYDSQGRSRKNISRFEDAQGQLATKAGLAYTAEEVDYDEKGRMTSSWKFGADNATFGGPIVYLEYFWETNGKLGKRVRQVCDVNRQPLSIVSNGTAAQKVEKFDFNEQYQDILETGFDEKVTGFATREAKFSNGKLLDVEFRLANGTQLSSVSVFISEVVPPPEQPKSAELKGGDQLVSVNGHPVKNAYDFVYSGFSGGYVEVVRNGQKIKIDGFNAGSLGVVLEDRGPK